MVSSGFGVETANISILAGPGSGARVQCIANILAGKGDKNQDPYLEGVKTRFSLILNGSCSTVATVLPLVLALRRL